MYKQVFDPVGDSLGLSSIFAAIPIIVLFVLLGGLKMKAHLAALISLVDRAHRRDRGLRDAGRPGARQSALRARSSGSSRSCGSSSMALWIYNMTVETGHFAVLRGARSTGSPTTSASRP